MSATLGTTDDAQRLESYEGEQKRRFMMHYNFPPFSVGEVGRMTGVGRREIGHGALASRAIEAVLPLRMSRRTRCAWCRTFLSRMDRRRWRRFAALRWR